MLRCSVLSDVSATLSLLLLSTCTAWAQGSLNDAAARELPAPTGPYAVGRTIFRWTDPTRPETLSRQPNDKRELIVWLWYPASSAPHGEIAPYIDHLDLLGGAFSDADLLLLRSVRAHSVADAKPSARPLMFPIILFSPGAESIPALYSSFCEELASHGYIVAALDHPYDDAVVLLADGRVVEGSRMPSDGQAVLSYERQRVTVRAQDAVFALNQLTRVERGEIQSPFKGRLDLARTGIFGHSIGGVTAVEACMIDERLRACANLDGVVYAMPAYPRANGCGPSQPFLFMEKPLPAMPGENPEDAQRRLDLLRSSGNALLACVVAGRSYRVTIADATHATFSDEEILRNDDDRRPRELMSRARNYLLAFFDERLHGVHSSLLNSLPADGAARIATFSPKRQPRTRK